MSTGATVSDAGLRDPDLNINGTSLILPAVLFPRPRLKQAVSPTQGRSRIDSWYDGVGLPDRSDELEFEFNYDLGSGETTEIAFLSRLRTTPGPHTLAFWKKYEYRWTATAGQVVFYLPRPDAYAKSYSGKTGDAYKAVVKVNGTPISAANTLYPGAVTSGTSVDAGKVAISTVAVNHPDAGYTVALFKFGTAPGAGAIVTVEYHPLWNVDVIDVETAAFSGDQPFRENKTLRFTEVN